MCSFSCAVLLSTNCLQQSESIGLRPTCSSVRKRFKAGRERRERGAPPCLGQPY